MTVHTLWTDVHRSLVTTTTISYVDGSQTWHDLNAAGKFTRDGIAKTWRMEKRSEWWLCSMLTGFNRLRHSGMEVSR
jgi:hypothetical protein